MIQTHSLTHALSTHPNVALCTRCPLLYLAPFTVDVSAPSRQSDRAAPTHTLTLTLSHTLIETTEMPEMGGVRIAGGWEWRLMNMTIIVRDGFWFPSPFSC